MTDGPPVADIARLLGEPTRAKMLLALADDRALPAGELAACADVTASTASGHLAALRQAGLVTCIHQGRHRYYRIASPDVADMLESIMVVAAVDASAVRSRVAPALQSARTCYKHLAGWLGVVLCDAMRTSKQIELEDNTARITSQGLALLDTLGVDSTRFRKRPWSRVCLVDWSERREHLAGPLGNALHKRFLELGWVEAHLDSRAISVTRTGQRGFQTTFGLSVTATN